jgi:hypothetical protein
MKIEERVLRAMAQVVDKKRVDALRCARVYEGGRMVAAVDKAWCLKVELYDSIQPLDLPVGLVDPEEALISLRKGYGARAVEGYDLEKFPNVDALLPRVERVPTKHRYDLYDLRLLKRIILAFDALFGGRKGVFRVAWQYPDDPWSPARVDAESLVVGLKATAALMSSA